MCILYNLLIKMNRNFSLDDFHPIYAQLSFLLNLMWSQPIFADTK